MSPDSPPAEMPDHQPPADAPAAVAETRAVSADGGVRFSSYEILPQQRLKHLDQGPVLAYAARPIGHTGAPTYYALVGGTWLIPRIKTAEIIAAIPNSLPFFQLLPLCLSARQEFMHSEVIGHL